MDFIFGVREALFWCKYSNTRVFVGGEKEPEEFARVLFFFEIIGLIVTKWMIMLSSHVSRKVVMKKLGFKDVADDKSFMNFKFYLWVLVLMHSCVIRVYVIVYY